MNANPRDLGKEALLVRSLQAGAGHVAVIGASSAAAREQARKALVKVNTAAVLHVSAAGVEEQSHPSSRHDASTPRPVSRDLMAPLLDQARAMQRPALIVVEDADATDADGLERIRAVVECDPDAIKWLRLVLVGGERLERILADPAAAALASRLCARVRIPAQSAESLSSPAVRITALATFSAALVALSLWYFVPAARHEASPRDADAVKLAASSSPHVATPSSQAASAPARDAVNATGPAPAAPVSSAPVLTDAAPISRADGEDATNASATERKADALTLDATAPAKTDGPPKVDVAAAPSRAEAPSDRSEAKSEAATASKPAPPAKVAAKTQASPEKPAKVAVAPTAKPKKTSVVGKAPAKGATPKVATAKPAAKTTVSASARPAAPAKPQSPSRQAAKSVAHEPRTLAKPPEPAPSSERVLEAGSFPDAKNAYALRSDVGARFDDERVLVARVDPEDGPPEYRVRVVGLGSRRDTADAAAALHDLGHDFVRYEKPGALERFGRRVRANLSGH